MPFDAVVALAVRREILALSGRRLHRLYPASPSCIVLELGGAGHPRVVVDLDPRWARIHLTARAQPALREPGPFVMRLRKHLEAARLEGVELAVGERVMFLRFAAHTALGDPRPMTLVAEILGPHANLVLVDHQGQVVDAWRRHPPTEAGGRMVWPQSPYMPPPPPRGLALEAPDAELCAALGRGPGDRPAHETLVRAVAEIGPHLATRALLTQGVEPSVPFNQVRELMGPLLDWARARYREPPTPAVLLDEQGRSVDAWVLPPPSGPYRVVATVSQALDEVQLQREATAAFEADRRERVRDVKRELERTIRREAAQRAEWQAAGEATALLELGKAILACAHTCPVGPGVLAVLVPGRTDPETIQLSPGEKASAVAEKLFTRYKRARRAREHLDVYLKSAAMRRVVLEARLAHLEHAQRPADLAAAAPTPPPVGTPGPSAPVARRLPRFRSPSGLEIRAGRSARDNDALTMRVARPQDLWFHARQQTGAHVLLRLGPGEVATPADIEAAARVAAHYSQGRGALRVTVDYTERRHVRKPTGAAVGFVIYDHERTLDVSPDEAHLPPRI